MAPGSLSLRERKSRRGRKTSAESALRRTAREYVVASSVHGVGYAFERGLPWPPRAAWVAVVATGMALAVMSAKQAYDEWRGHMVLTTIRTVALPVEEVEFPSVTICAQGKPLENAHGKLEMLFLEVTSAAGIENTDDPPWLLRAIDVAFPGLIAAEDRSWILRGSMAPLENILQVLALASKYRRSGDPDWGVRSNLHLVDLVTQCTLYQAGIVQELPPCLAKEGNVSSYRIAPREDVFGSIHVGDCIDLNRNQRQNQVPCVGESFGTNLALKILEEFESPKELAAQRGNWTKYLSGYVWAGLRYDSQERYWHRLSDGKKFNPWATLSREEGSPSEKDVATACMKVKAGRDDDEFLTYAVVDCDDGNQEAAALCHRLGCPLTMGQMLDSAGLNGTDHNGYLRYNLFDLMRNPALEETFDRGLGIVKESMRVAYSRLLHSPTSRRSLMRLLWISTLPCLPRGRSSLWNWKEEDKQLHTIKWCSWRGRRVPCQRVFVAAPTDMGMCCVFNAGRAEEVYAEGHYARMLKEFRAGDAFVADEQEGGGEKAKIEMEEDELDEDGHFSAKTTRSGIMNGLTVFLDARQDVLNAATVSTDSNAFVVYLGAQSEYPWPGGRGFLVEPGHETSVRLSATKVTADRAEIGSIPPRLRGCYFPEEVELRAHGNYTMTNCLYECTVEAVNRQMQWTSNVTCLPWFFVPLEPSTPFCDPWQAREFLALMSGLVPSRECARCLPDCEVTTYSHSPTSALLRRCDTTNVGTSSLCDFATDLNPPRWGERLIRMYGRRRGQLPAFASDVLSSERYAATDLMEGDNGDESYDSFGAGGDMAKVNFFFDSNTAVEFRRQAALTPVGFTSQVGGLAGLFMGFSFISLFELVYWFTYRLGRNLTKGARI